MNSWLVVNGTGSALARITRNGRSSVTPQLDTRWCPDLFTSAPCWGAFQAGRVRRFDRRQDQQAQ
jgi:hypothetical protein